MKCESLEILPTLKGAIYCLWNNAVKVLQSELNQKWLVYIKEPDFAY